MSAIAAALAGPDRIRIVEWIGARREPFELMDVQGALDVRHDTARRVCRDMEARGLLERFRAPANGRPTMAQMWRVPE